MFRQVCVGTLGHGAAALAGTFQAPIIVHNVADAAVIAIQRARNPFPVHGFTDGTQVVSARSDVAAGLGIRAARQIAAALAIAISVAIPITVAIAVVVTVSIAVLIMPGDAAELAILVADIAAALGELWKRSFHPSPVTGLAARPEHVPLHADVTARLGIRTAGLRPVALADERAIVVADVAPAAVGVIEHRVTVVPVNVLASCPQIVAADADILAGLLITSGRIVHRRCAGFRRLPEDDHYNHTY